MTEEATTVDPLRALVARAVQRDPDAWEILFRRSYQRLHAYARRRLFDDRAAEDAVSETMTRALDGIDRFTWTGGGFDAWLYGIVRNVVYETIRMRQRPAPVTLAEVGDDDGPEASVLAEGDRAAMRRAFGRLDPDEREILELRIEGGLSSEEVGQLLDKNAGAVRMAQARALQRLRVMYEEVGHAG